MMTKIISAIPGISTTETEIERFLESNLNLQLATLEEDNYPNINQVWFYYDKDSGKIYATTHKESRKIQNILKNPDKIYFSIDDENFYTEGLKGVKGRARATIISEDRQKVISVEEKICLKYLGTLDDPWAKQLIENAAEGTFVGIEIAPKFFSAYVLSKMEEARSIS
jgi:nitroimidazol reductase NimA-like FMN-containing flavoprotein (pyridoxamine 5'-phosphate oxidase superfamily)